MTQEAGMKQHGNGSLQLTDTLNYDGITITVQTTRFVEFPRDRDAAHRRHEKAVQRAQALLNDLDKD